MTCGGEREAQGASLISNGPSVGLLSILRVTCHDSIKLGMSEGFLIFDFVF